MLGEDDLYTFDGWLRYQGIDPVIAPPDELAEWQKLFAEIRKRPNPKVGLMKLRPIPGEYRYAVAIREAASLWLTLWLRRSPKREFFVMQPRSDRGWDPHVSYHFNGKLQPQRPAPKWAAPTPNRSAPNRPRPKSHNHCAEVLVAISGAFVFWLLSSTIDAMVA
jgi:hypothetical protein